MTISLKLEDTANDFVLAMNTRAEINETEDDVDVEAAWAAGIEGRIADVESGMETLSWEEARARVRGKLSKTSLTSSK